MIQYHNTKNIFAYIKLPKFAKIQHLIKELSHVANAARFRMDMKAYGTWDISFRIEINHK